MAADPAEARDLGSGANLTSRGADAARGLSGAVAGSGARAGHARRRGAAAAGEPGLRQRRRGADRPQGRAAAGRHDGALRRSRPRVGAVRRAASTPRRSRCWRRSWRPIPTTSTRRCAWRRRTRRSATTRWRWRRSGRPAQLAPRSIDVRTYLALHYARGKDWPRAVPLLEQVVAESPERVPALEALAVVRERQGRIADAIELRQKIYPLRPPSAGRAGATGAAGDERAADGRGASRRSRPREPRDPQGFSHDLELGVLYLAARRFQDAAAALDRVPVIVRRLPDGAVQARAGQRAAARARPGGPHRGGPSPGGRDDEAADREGAIVSGSK